MRSYVITTGVVFSLLVVLHIWRVVVEGTQLMRDPWWVLITAAAAGLSIWAFAVVRRSQRS
jgi:NO-binding membrane sensor protein with MHYT domain